MPDNNPPPTPQGGDPGGAGGEPQGGQPQPQGGPPKWAAEFGDSFDPEKAYATIIAQRDSEKDLKKRANAAEKALQDIRDKDLPETERLNKRLVDLEKALADRERELGDVRLRSGVTAIASRLGYTDPDDAWRFIDRSAVTFDSDGEPKNLQKVLEDLLASKPYLAKSAGPGDWGAGSTGRAPGGKTDMDAIIRRQAGLG
jgi:hypothetical protein